MTRIAGEFPGNSKTFWADIQDPELPADFLADVTFGMFGMGDSGYVFFNEAANWGVDRTTLHAKKQRNPFGFSIYWI